MNADMISGLLSILTPSGLLCVFAGTLIGLLIGAMPGLSATMGIAILLPLTYSLGSYNGIAMLLSLYMGAMYGGSISAILINTPGTPAAAATSMDGYPLARSGQASRALGISLFASFVGGVISTLFFLFLAPVLGKLALRFSAVETCAVAVLGITIIGSLSRGSAVLGLLSGVIGLLLAMIGQDTITGYPRYCFGILHLYSGIPYTAALIGLFSIPQAMRLIEAPAQKRTGDIKVLGKLLPDGKDLRKTFPTILMGSLIGTIVGIIPGSGGDTACWFSYNEAKRFAKDKSRFGLGDVRGVAASESSNNAVVGGAMIPTVALGIPGSSSTAIILGALMIHGIVPGPTLMSEHGQITYALIWALMLSNAAMFLEGIAVTKFAINITKINDHIIAPAIVVLAVIGAFAVQNSMFDVIIMLVFGIIGYFMGKIGMPTAPMVIGLILGSMMDSSLHQSLLLGHGSLTIFAQKPIALVLLCLALLSILQATPLFGMIRAKLRKR